MLTKELLAIWKTETMTCWTSKMCGGNTAATRSKLGVPWSSMTRAKHKELDGSCKKLALEHSAIYVYFKCIFSNALFLSK